MLTILSPAKNMRPAASALPLTPPLFGEEAGRLAAWLKTLPPWELESGLKLNPTLGLKAYGYYQDFDPAAPGAAALLSYYGLAYQHLRPEEFTPEELAYAQDHLRVLSALYGLLRPLDAIQPYRLELQGGLRIEGQSLYAYWGEKPARALFSSGEPVINLASGEYARLIARHRRPGDRLVTCEFCVVRRGKRLMLATGAKMARGEMARYIVKNRVEQPEALHAFEWDGYAYVPSLSSSDRYVYIQG